MRLRVLRKTDVTRPASQYSSCIMCNVNRMRILKNKNRYCDERKFCLKEECALSLTGAKPDQHPHKWWTSNFYIVFVLFFFIHFGYLLGVLSHFHWFGRLLPSKIEWKFPCPFHFEYSTYEGVHSHIHQIYPIVFLGLVKKKFRYYSWCFEPEYKIQLLNRKKRAE